MPSQKVTSKNSFYVDRVHNEHKMERLKVLCLLLKHAFAIIFSVLPPGYGGTTETIIFLPSQLRKDDRKQEELLFCLVTTTKANFFITEATAAEAIFLSPGRIEGRNLTGVVVTLQHFSKKRTRTDSDARFQPVC